MTRILQGIVRENMIELYGILGVPEGLSVEVIVRTLPHPTRENQPTIASSGHGLLRTEGALADDVEWEAIMAEIQQGRDRDIR